MVSIEGGPGYSTTSSRSGRIALWQPVNLHRNLLLVDLRGTGKSTPLSCDAFKLHNNDYIDRGGNCARQIGPRRDYFGTAAGVIDIQRVLMALRQGKVDMYGDSYGSYAAQAFALRFPNRLRTLTLDGTYQLPGSDPLFSDLAAASRSGLRLACRRAPTCPVSGDPVAQLQQFVQRVRAHPITGASHDGDGNPVTVTVNEDALVQVVQAQYANPMVFRNLSAAIISAEHGDNAPILQIVAENIHYDYANGPWRDYSEADYLSVICHDYPQPWSFSTPMADRAAEAAGRLAARPASQFAPFSPQAWTNVRFQGGMACRNWPSPANDDPVVPPHAVYPHVPTLVLNGDLDNITPLADARIVASRFPNSTLVDVHNSVHVTAIEDANHCASVIYERFVRNRTPGDTSCAARVPETRVVGHYPLALRNVFAARPLAGDHSTVRQRRMAAAAAATVADALRGWWVSYSGVGVGLRGGSWSYTGFEHTRFTLTNDRFVPGVKVSGHVDWTYYTGAVASNVTVQTGPTTVHLKMNWSLNVAHDRARITGSGGGRTIVLSMLAP